MRDILRLAVPVIAAELGWMAMGVVDTVMVGPLGPTAIGAVGVGNAVFEVTGLFGIGLLLGLDTLVSQAHGAGRRDECDQWLWHGVYLALVSAVVLMGLVAVAGPQLRHLGIQPGVFELAMPYVYALNWSVLPLLLYAAFRRYLQGVHKPGIVTFALVSANLVNAAGNAWLIPTYGVEGSGWSTLGARIYMALVLAVYAFVTDRELFRVIPAPSWSATRVLLGLGGPVAMQWLLEIGVFATTTLLAARLAPESLAAHHITMQIVATTFMVPLGLSSAGAVVVGNAIGAGKLKAAKRSGWITIWLAVLVMSVAAAVLLLFPHALAGVFTKNVEVLRLVVPLLYVSALFQIFDGIQVTATGVLRGAGDTRTSMLTNLVAHWGLGLPTGYLLCFVLGWGVIGLWAGLSAGLMVVAVVLLFWWRRYLPRALATHS